ncbi:transporter [Sandaracinus amylolyticus]|uniref:transporter n=1 Tax=Sandaracinus amylolyticus TaxID=927083 RepID=UPI001F25AB44|nr:transporter [Sandaracinus amylolyticus]UJR85317.1 Hypothetical protein I5071_73970 [Sandaracinus amylolyticus]
MPVRSLALLFALVALAAPSLARACATCGCGDPTLTAVGVEQPFAGRVRLSLALTHLSYSEGRGLARVEVFDQRAILGVAASPNEWLTLSVFAPLVWREVAHASLQHESTIGVGDPELRARFVLFRDRAFAPEHLLSAQVGARLPTPTRLHDDNGALLPLDAQTGSGSFDPMVGLAWSWFARELSMHTTALLTVPTEGTGGWRNGASVRLAWQGQWQPMNELALVIGVDARIDADPLLRGETQAGGGAVVFASPGVMISPGGDVLLWLVARLPFVQALTGDRADGPIVELGMALDV